MLPSVIARVDGSLPIQPHGGITLTCCNFISSNQNEIGIELIAEGAALPHRRAFYPGPRRPGTGLERRPVSTSSLSLRTVDSRRPDGARGLLPDLCSRGVRPSRSLRDGAGGFLPGMLLGCLGMGQARGEARPFDDDA